MNAADRSGRVEEVRQALLALHKTLIEAQRVPYERAHGRIETSNQYLGLLLEHPDFEWIRALSALIARLDAWDEGEAGEEGSRAREASLDALLAELRALISRDAEPRPEFTRRYWEMVDSSPDVLVAHVQLWRLLGE